MYIYSIIGVKSHLRNSRTGRIAVDFSSDANQTGHCMHGWQIYRGSMHLARKPNLGTDSYRHVNTHNVRIYCIHLVCGIDWEHMIDNSWKLSTNIKHPLHSFSRCLVLGLTAGLKPWRRHRALKCRRCCYNYRPNTLECLPTFVTSWRGLGPHEMHPLPPDPQGTLKQSGAIILTTQDKMTPSHARIAWLAYILETRWK